MSSNTLLIYGRNGAGRSRARQEIELAMGEAEDDAGNCASSRLRTQGYMLMALTAVAIARKVLAGFTPAGFQTPSRAYGPDFILEFEGVVRSDE